MYKFLNFIFAFLFTEGQQILGGKLPEIRESYKELHRSQEYQWGGL